MALLTLPKVPAPPLHVPPVAPPPSWAVRLAVWFWQIVTSAPTLTNGNGYTVIVKVVLAPVQVVPPVVNCGVTVMVAVCTDVVEFKVTKAGMLPVPEAAKPIDELLLVQLYTVPANAPENVTAVVDVPLHIV